eukprot:1196102-Prorocentrum_minimum.AAC.2
MRRVRTNRRRGGRGEAVPWCTRWDRRRRRRPPQRGRSAGSPPSPIGAPGCPRAAPSPLAGSTGMVSAPRRNTRTRSTSRVRVAAAVRVLGSGVIRARRWGVRFIRVLGCWVQASLGCKVH